MRRPTGFTLVEILVVLTIIGVMASLVTFSLGGNEQRVLKSKTDNIANKIRAAADVAIFNNLEVGLALDKKSYQFIYFNTTNGNWEALKKDGLEDGSLDSETFSLDVENRPVTLPDKINKLLPAVVFLSSGEITRFMLTMQDKDVKTAYVISTDDGAEINVEGK